MDKADKENSYLKEDFLLKTGKDFFDNEISCYVEDKGSIKGMLLFAHDNFGILQVAALFDDNNYPAAKESMIEFAASLAEEELDYSDCLNIPIGDEDNELFCDKYFDTSKAGTLVKAVYIKPEFDIDEKKWKEISDNSLSDEDKDILYDSFLEDILSRV